MLNNQNITTNKLIHNDLNKMTKSHNLSILDQHVKHILKHNHEYTTDTRHKN